MDRIIYRIIYRGTYNRPSSVIAKSYCRSVINNSLPSLVRSCTALAVVRLFVFNVFNFLRFFTSPENIFAIRLFLGTLKHVIFVYNSSEMKIYQTLYNYKENIIRFLDKTYKCLSRLPRAKTFFANS